MYRGDWLTATSATGGSGNLVLSSITGAPNYSDMLGTTGTLNVDYTIQEFTDSSHGTLVRQETGMCPLALGAGGGTLQRSNNGVTRTWDSISGGYKPRLGGGGAPGLLTFGSTAANILISCNLSVDSFLDAQPFRQLEGVAGGLYIGTNSGNFPGTATSGIMYWFPVRIIGRLSQISQVAIKVSTAATLSGASSALFFGLYECSGAGVGGINIGNLIADFGNGAAISTLAATGEKVGTLTNPIVNPGWCFGGLLMTYTNAGDNPAVQGFYGADNVGLNSNFNLVGFASQSGQTGLPANGGSASGGTQSIIPGVAFG